MSRKLTLRSLRNDFFAASSCSASPWGHLLSFSLFFFLHSMVQAQILHITSLGDLALVGLNKNEKLQSEAAKVVPKGAQRKFSAQKSFLRERA